MAGLKSGFSPVVTVTGQKLSEVTGGQVGNAVINFISIPIKGFCRANWKACHSPYSHGDRGRKRLACLLRPLKHRRLRRSLERIYNFSTQYHQAVECHHALNHWYISNYSWFAEYLVGHLLLRWFLFPGINLHRHHDEHGYLHCWGGFLLIQRLHSGPACELSFSRCSLLLK